MASRAKKQQQTDMEDHIFEYRKDGEPFFCVHRVYTDEATGQTKVNEHFIPDKADIREKEKGGYYAYLDGRRYYPEPARRAANGGLT